MISKSFKMECVLILALIITITYTEDVIYAQTNAQSVRIKYHAKHAYKITKSSFHTMIQQALITNVYQIVHEDIMITQAFALNFQINVNHVSVLTSAQNAKGIIYYTKDSVLVHVKKIKYLQQDNASVKILLNSYKMLLLHLTLNKNMDIFNKKTLLFNLILCSCNCW